jgi:predicted XRE-type DNA-binding protein
MTKHYASVWDALEDDPSERESVKLKSRLMVEIARRIKSMGITQAKAAKTMGVSQPRVSDLVNGKIDRFTIDMLVTMLSRIGMKVEVKLKAA